MQTSEFLGMLVSAIGFIGIRVVWALVLLNLANQICLLIGTLLDFCIFRSTDWHHDADGVVEETSEDVASIEPTRPDVSAWLPGRGRVHRLGSQARGF